MLKTELRNPATTHIDTASTFEMVQLLQAANEQAACAVGAVTPQISAVIEAAAERMLKGGRLFYVGCGTSGRLGVLDASECPPTYGTDPALVVGLIAGGEKALRSAVEGAEDDDRQGKADLEPFALAPQDTIVGLSAAGGAGYVLGALRYAQSCGCLTVAVTCNEGSALDTLAQLSICPDTGAEPITGSTRMKAGTAQKMILNMISTGVMIRLGNVCENLMINLRPTNEKLKARCIRIAQELTGLDAAAAQQALQAAEWNLRAVVRQYRKEE